MAKITSSAVFAACARDCAQYLPNVLANLERISKFYDLVAWVIIENDSIDETKNILRQWAHKRPNANVLTFNGLTDQSSSRSERIAVARNKYLDFINKSPYRVFDHLYVVDLDFPNAALFDAEQVNAAVGFLNGNKGVAAVFANSAPVYYDIWALRHPQWCPSDCWLEVQQYAGVVGGEKALEHFVYSRQIAIESNTPPIQVYSAFGGFGIYRMEWALRSRYNGKTSEGVDICEHVPFNQEIVRGGGQLYIFPALRNQAPTEHLSGG